MATVGSRIVFVGTGVCSATPMLGHLSRGTEGPRCPVCEDALNPFSRNRRNSASLFIEHRGGKILFDTGKTFREAYLRVLLSRKVRNFDAVILSHGDADSLVGVDDLRDFQIYEAVEGTTMVKCMNPIRVALTDTTLQRLRKVAPYVTEPSLKGNVIVERRVTLLDFCILKWTEGSPRVQTMAQIIPGLDLVAFSVQHGQSEALGFCFGSTTKVVYLPNISAMPDAALQFLRSLGGIDILIVDCIGPAGETHIKHFNLAQAWALALCLQPTSLICTSIGCGHNHYTLCDELEHLRRRDGEKCPRLQTVTCAYDGLELCVSL